MQAFLIQIASRVRQIAWVAKRGGAPCGHPKLLNSVNQDVDNRLDFDLKFFIERYGLKAISACHVGAHKGDEIPAYMEAGIEKAIFIEPLSENFNVLQARLSDLDNYSCVKLAVGSTACEVTINLSSNDLQSSSVLTPKLHLSEAPHVTFQDTELVSMTTLDAILENFGRVDFVIIDVQGYELEVLLGAANSLSQVKYIFVEVNRAETYIGCAQIQDIDLYLKRHDFARTLTRWWGSWGDALYIRNSLLPIEAIQEFAQNDN